MSRLSFIVTALLVGTGSSPLTAAEPNPGPPGMFTQLIPAMCPALVGQLSADPNVKRVLAGKGMDSGLVCQCANGRFLADREVSRVNALGMADLARQSPNQEQITAYVVSRAMQHILFCVSDEFDRILASVTLPLVPAPGAQ